MFNRLDCALAWTTAFVALVFVAGCGGGELAQVSGTVTLDGQPLEGAQVSFWPLDGEGEKDRPSAGVTDSNGQYRLMYTAEESGVLIGRHRVEISTASGGEEGPKPERIPPQYNTRSELTAEVTSGENILNFDLSSKPSQPFYESPQGAGAPRSDS